MRPHPGRFTYRAAPRWKPKGNDIFAVPTESYGFANKRLSRATIPPLLERASPLRTGHLRDPLGAETHFASESFIDEVAHAAGVDPAAIANAIFDATGVRLRKVPLTAERMKEALARAAIA
jgi:hypothetical protein